jgi:hypothetical protein
VNQKAKKPFVEPELTEDAPLGEAALLSLVKTLTSQSTVTA